MKPKRSDPSYQRWWRKQNPASNAASQRKYYLANKARIAATNHRYRMEHLEHLKACMRKTARRYYWLHRDEILAKTRANRIHVPRKPRKRMPDDVRRARRALACKQWRAVNRERRRLYEKGRRALPEVVIKNRLCARLHKVVTMSGVRKGASQVELFGASPFQLKAHIESLFAPGMGWHNRELWHIDHKRPCKAFDLTNPEEQKRCFHYTNLQPLWAKDNLSKSSKHDLPRNKVPGASQPTTHR